ncbi:dynein intermediate chain 2, axonemal-like [Belonocnema kinseyi]|uniref:dynein intermediate chain 2, axonemal-like n=1 Tax=Belonocnema kinseyi TaxID=2817044 RepID=UPI00143CE90C|nr:dynein intermediate chain 2, axonemal-like [Belonocnema kinseyi]
MRSTHVYVKTRALLGKQCIFNIQNPYIDEIISPEPSLYDNYILQNTCHKSVQVSKQFSLHEAQTVGKSCKNNGMFHFEGGWPKEINPRDKETIARFRRRIEKQDHWALSMRILFSNAESYILQNGAINVYDHHFNDMIPTELARPRYLRTINVYADPGPTPRPVNNISWSPDSVTKIAVTYYCTEFRKVEEYNFVSYIWNIENSNQPWTELEPKCPAVVTEFNPRDPSLLASGLMSGQVCFWDIRTGNVPIQQSDLQFSHRSPASCLKWILSKGSSEFFTGSSDGRIMWWDIRKLREPTEILIIDLDNTEQPKVQSAIGVTSLNYDPSMGTKFLLGTENGVIISGSRKSTTHANKLSLKFQGHYGPVYSLDRNPFNPKYILSIGDWTSRIWVEDTKEGNIVATPYVIQTLMKFILMILGFLTQKGQCNL